MSINKNVNIVDEFYLKNNMGVLNGRICLIKKLGAGGQAIVFQAYDLKEHQKCAVKILTEVNDFNLKCLEVEVKAMQACVHQNILKLIDYGYS